MLGSLPPVVFHTWHGRRPAEASAELEVHLPRRVRVQECCEAWRGSCLRLACSRACSKALLAGVILLIVYGVGGGFICGTAADLPRDSGSPKDHLDAQNASGRDLSTGRGRKEDKGAPDALTNATLGVNVQQRALPLGQQQPQHQQQPTKSVEGKSSQSIPLWTSMFRLFGQPETSQPFPNWPHPPPSTNPPQPLTKPGGTPPLGVLQSPIGRASSASGATGGSLLTPGTPLLSPMDFLKTGMGLLPGEGQLTPEEEEDEAIADAIIHGVGKKQVPRIRTGVDALVEALDDQILQQRATSPRQLEVLRMRRQADAKARRPTVEIPEYFSRLAKEAAAYHRQRQEEQKARDDKQPPTALGQHVKKLVQRRRQKDKLLLWRENQIYQSPEEDPRVDERVAEALRTHRELEEKLHEELSKEDLLWATGGEEAAEKDALDGEKEKMGEQSTK